LAFGVSVVFGRGDDVVFGSADVEAFDGTAATVHCSLVLFHGDAIESEGDGGFDGELEFDEGEGFVVGHVGRDAGIGVGDDIEAIELEIEEFDDLGFGDGRRKVGDEEALGLAGIGGLEGGGAGGGLGLVDESLQLARIHLLLSGSSREREHARHLCLFGRDILVAGRFDVPLSQAASSFKDADNISEVGRGFSFLGRGASSTSLASSSCLLGKLVVVISTLPIITTTSGRSASTTAAIVEEVSVSSGPSVVVSPSWTSISVPLSVVSVAVAVFSFSVAVVAT
jgi:hypothetical protein